MATPGESLGTKPPPPRLGADALSHVTPYTVNTMTLTAKSTVTDVDFGALFDKYGDSVREASDDLEQPGGATASAEVPRVVFIVQRGRGGEVVQAGCVRKKNGRVKRYSPNVFENQATLVVRMPSGTHTNVKLFRNGHVQMTGSRSEKEGRMAAELVVSMAASARSGAPRPAGAAVVGPVNVCLMNSDFRIIGGHVDRQALYEVATDVMGVQSSFQPAIYPAVKCFYMWRPETGDGSNRCLPYPRPGLAGPDRGMGPDLRPTAQDCDGVCPLHSAGGAGRGCDGKGCCKRVTILIFHTGATIVTGGVSENQIRACHEWVASLCAAHGRKFFL
jgi:TATA-box binding protein (TBP) (component of TFIID and TFIIIB)